MDQLGGALATYLEVGDAEAWYEWIWVGPIQLLSWALRWILVLIFAFLVYFLFTMVGSVIAAPLLDLLSERVERVYTGSLAESESGFLANALRSLREEGTHVELLAKPDGIYKRLSQLQREIHEVYGV